MTSAPTLALLGGPARSRPVMCLAYHEIASDPCPAIRELGITTTPAALTHQLDHVKRQYQVIGLDQLLAGDIPERAAMITFDDAYRSVREIAAPLLAERRLPAVMFANPGPVARSTVPLDCLASFFAVTHGVRELARVASAGTSSAETIAGVMDGCLSQLDLGGLAQVKGRLLARLDLRECDLHRHLGIFMTPADLAALPAMGVEIANHTMSHVHCGPLGATDLNTEIVNAKDLLAELSGQPVRAFAFPWGRSSDATPAALQAIRESGHLATFLMHGRNNHARPADDIWYRVLMTNQTGARLWSALGVEPRLRELKALALAALGRG